MAKDKPKGSSLPTQTVQNVVGNADLKKNGGKKGK